MRNHDRDTADRGLKAAALCTVLYLTAIIAIAVTTDVRIYFALLGAPAFAYLVYCLFYTLKTGIVSLPSPEKIRKSYDNPVDGYFRSEYEKDIGCVTLSIVLFLPAIVFLLLFSWVWYLVKRNGN